MAPVLDDELEQDARELLSRGCSDEDVEQRLGVSLQTIIGLRAGLAAASRASSQA